MLSSRLGLDRYELSERLHALKRAVGIRGGSVWICLDDGEVYDPSNGRGIGGLYYNAQRDTFLSREEPVSTVPRHPMATLRLFADDLLPADVDRIMGIRPNASARKGDGLLRRGDGSRSPARTGTWFITSAKKDLGDRPEDHLAWLVGMLSEHIDQLREKIPEIVIAHPGIAAIGTASTSRSLVGTAVRRSFVVLTTERKAA